MSWLLHHLRVNWAVGRGDAARAIEYLERVVESNPNDPYALQMLAQFYESRDEDEKAITYAIRALAFEPDDLLTLEVAYHYYKHVGDYDRAYGYLCRALDQPHIEVPDPPRFLIAVFRFLGLFFPLFRRAHRVAKTGPPLRKYPSDRWREEAEEWKASYERQHGILDDKSVH